MHDGRLYYAADDVQVWSVGINLDGTFAGDPRWEVDVTGLASTNPVSDIIFDDQGRMILAQRGEQRGSYDYTVFAEPLLSSVVRYRREIPDDPTTPSVWVEVRRRIRHRHAARKAATPPAASRLATAMTRSGACTPALAASFCGRPATRSATIRRLPPQLAAGGPAIVHGLQGNDKDFVRPQNDPPFSSYFTDYDSTFDDPRESGPHGRRRNLAAVRSATRRRISRRRRYHRRRARST